MQSGFPSLYIQKAEQSVRLSVALRNLLIVVNYQLITRSCYLLIAHTVPVIVITAVPGVVVHTPVVGSCVFVAAGTSIWLGCVWKSPAV